MGNDIVKAYIWNEIIRLGFSPSGQKEQKKWLYQFTKGLMAFWDLSSMLELPKYRGVNVSATIDVADISFEYSIEAVKKFCIRIMYTDSSIMKGVMWTHDLDGVNYFLFPKQQLLIELASCNTALKSMEEMDVETVVNSLITHPTPHQHIESPIDDHEIRIGGGIENPFLYLFCMRYQLCPDNSVRKAEKKRLTSLFYNAIRNKDAKIPFSNLMAMPKDYL